MLRKAEQLEVDHTAVGQQSQIHNPACLAPDLILLSLFMHEESEAQRGQVTCSRSHC